MSHVLLYTQQKVQNMRFETLIQLHDLQQITVNESLNGMEYCKNIHK